MEPLKVVQIGKISEGSLCIYATQLPHECFLFFIKEFNNEGFQRSASKAGADLSFQLTIEIEEGISRKDFKLDYNFPRLRDIAERNELLNLMEYYDEVVFGFGNSEDRAESKIDTFDIKYLQRFWCLSNDLVWIDRPCRNAEDYAYIRLKVEEFIFEQREEYYALIRKVERLRKT